MTDASVVVGPGRRALRLGAATDYDALAGAVVAGHVIECGAQATGGNFAFFTEIARPDAAPGLPARRDRRRRLVGDHQARRHRRRGHVGTVTAQLLYEIAGAALRRTPT